LPTLWGNDERFRTSYLNHFPGYYETSDAGMMDEDGYLHIMSRTDDIINVAGHRLSTGGMEEVLASHPAVAECAVLGVHCDLKGQKPLGLIVLKSGVTETQEAIEQACIQLVRSEIGAVAALRNVMGSSVCPKRGLEKSFVLRSARLPMARLLKCRLRLMIRSFLMRSRWSLNRTGWYRQ